MFRRIHARLFRRSGLCPPVARPEGNRPPSLAGRVSVVHAAASCPALRSVTIHGEGRYYGVAHAGAVSYAIIRYALFGVQGNRLLLSKGGAARR